MPYFRPENDFKIFDEFLKRRPEVSEDKLREDLERYYLPFVEKLIVLKKKKTTSDGLVVGVSAIQGAGKTTQGEIIEILLDFMGHQTVSLSIDDHYITHKELCDLRNRDPRFIRRGVTHDLPLAILNLRDLQKMTDEWPIIISGYDKGVHSGDGDRFRWVNVEDGVTLKAHVIEEHLVVNKSDETVLALRLKSCNYQGQVIAVAERMGSSIPIKEHFLPNELVEFLNNHQNQDLEVVEEDLDHIKFTAEGGEEVKVSKKGMPKAWRVVAKKPDFIFYDGWMLGARQVKDDSAFDQNLPALEKEEDKEFAKYVNKKLENYELLWQMIEYMNVLYVENYEMSIKWRDQAEEALREKGEGMTHDQIRDFVHYFWRSIHPGIHIKNLAHDIVHAQQVVKIQDDHSIGEVLLPQDLK